MIKNILIVLIFCITAYWSYSHMPGVNQTKGWQEVLAISLFYFSPAVLISGILVSKGPNIKYFLWFVTTVIIFTILYIVFYEIFVKSNQHSFFIGNEIITIPTIVIIYLFQLVSVFVLNRVFSGDRRG